MTVRQVNDDERANLVAVLILAGTVVALYLPGLRGGFVWLDHREIVEGALIVDSPRDIPGLFLHGRDFAGYHRPVYALIHSLDRGLWGLNPFGFHLSSLALHVMNALGVFVLARKLGAAWCSVGARFALAALWALHPTNNPTVGLIHAKADLLVTTLMLCALAATAAALDRGGWRAAVCYGAAIIAFVVALYTKELAFVLPPAVAAGAPWKVMGPPMRRKLGRALGMATTLCALVLVHRTFAGGAAGYASPVGLGERVLTFATVWVQSIHDLLLPANPTLADTTTVWSALPLTTRMQCTVAFLFLVLAGASTWRYLPSARPFLALHVGFTLPAAQIVPLLHFRAERFLYLPTLGLVGLGVVLARAASEYWCHPRRFALGSGVACIVLTIVEVQLGRQRLSTFTDDITLFTHELARTPDYREGAAALARALDREGRYNEATTFHERAARVDPRRISYAAEGGLVVNHAQNLLARRRFSEALSLIEARGHLATDGRAREELDYNRAIALARTGRPAEAFPLFERYVDAHPADADAHFLLGRTALAMGRSAQARVALEAYLRLAPRAPDRDIVRGWLARSGELGE